MSPPPTHPSPFKCAQQQNNSTLISNFMGFVKAKLLINQRSLYQGWTFHRLCVAFQSNPSQFFLKRQDLAQRDLRTSKHFSGDQQTLKLKQKIVGLDSVQTLMGLIHNPYKQLKRGQFTSKVSDLGNHIFIWQVVTLRDTHFPLVVCQGQHLAYS